MCTTWIKIKTVQRHYFRAVISECISQKKRIGRREILRDVLQRIGLYAVGAG